ncbi:MAG: 50S ribosomal protein L11 methyltransferase, partial [Sphingopyxis sp.]
AGCLRQIDRLRRIGRAYRSIIDVGTGTGLLAFAAMHLWPRAYTLASDIDPVSVRVTGENAAANGVPLGRQRGQLDLVVADGTGHPFIAASAPYDLIIANILAGPLITLAPALAAIAMPGTTVILAGLLNRQRAAVVSAYRRAGFRLDDDGGDAEWPALRMTMRQRVGWRRPVRAGGGGAGLPPGDFGSW